MENEDANEQALPKLSQFCHSLFVTFALKINWNKRLENRISHECNKHRYQSSWACEDCSQSSRKCEIIWSLPWTLWNLSSLLSRCLKAHYTLTVAIIIIIIKTCFLFSPGGEFISSSSTRWKATDYDRDISDSNQEWWSFKLSYSFTWLDSSHHSRPSLRSCMCVQ